MTKTTPELELPSPNFRTTPGPLPALHPFWVGRASEGIYAPHQQEDIWSSTYDLTCNRPHTRWIFSGIWFPTWNPSVSRTRPYH
ncbi:hypothetical protein AVEN_142814-1 [Araneus ventricosus]|uniref:Uncharacterized protein n=1 Tax=Araneus ventricosus TaxID=182803 RepID=A0A4Y2RI60_ARAVE|nr:hypothetical protein AVEN_142814-1 [Araneus ventricosus]